MSNDNWSDLRRALVSPADVAEYLSDKDINLNGFQFELTKIANKWTTARMNGWRVVYAPLKGRDYFDYIGAYEHTLFDLPHVLTSHINAIGPMRAAIEADVMAVDFWPAIESVVKGFDDDDDDDGQQPELVAA